MKYELTVAIIGTGYMGKTYAKVLDTLVSKMIFCSTDEEAGSSIAVDFIPTILNCLKRKKLILQRYACPPICTVKHLLRQWSAE